MSRYDLERSELADLLLNEPDYRVTQLFDGLYHHFVEPSELTNLPASLRARLAAEPALEAGLQVMKIEQADREMTTKWLFGLADGRAIETVLMYYPSHATVCVSSQAGCAMGCTFCATGQAGYERHLSSGEILEQVIRAARQAREDNRRLDNVVFMGMGEPFANFNAVWRSVERLVADVGLGARHITLSTVGLIPQIRRLAQERLQVNLAVSLHGARDQLRNELVPINRRYPLEQLMEACSYYVQASKRRLSFEWALIDQVNDTERDVEELAQLALRVRAHVNVIALNDTALGESRGLRAPTATRLRAFRDGLLARGVNVTVRQTRGRSIDAACGQLAASNVQLKPTRLVASPEPQVI